MWTERALLSDTDRAHCVWGADVQPKQPEPLQIPCFFTTKPWAEVQGFTGDRSLTYHKEDNSRCLVQIKCQGV